MVLFLQLVEAFHATLEEVVEADLLVVCPSFLFESEMSHVEICIGCTELYQISVSFSLQHVLDCTAPNLDEHRSTVLHVLQQIGVSEEKLKSMIEVWNKVYSHPFSTFST